MTPRQKEAAKAVAAGTFYPGLVREDDGWHARWRGVGADNAWIDEIVRSAAMSPLSEDAEDQKHETLHDAWLLALRSRTGLVAWDDAECEEFARTLEEWSAGARPDAKAREALVFEFAAGPDGFSVSCAAPRGRRALRELGSAAYVWGPLRGMKAQDGGKRISVALERAEAEDFVRGGAADLRAAGFGVSGVDLAAPVDAEAEVEDPGPSAPARAKLTVRVAGLPVTAEEIRFLLEQNSTLVFFRDRWIEVDRGILKEALRALEKDAAKKVNPIAFALGIGRVGRLEVENATAGGRLRAIVDRLLARGGDLSQVCPMPPEGFCGTLRDYQRAGAAWLRFMTDNGFGALLADDMGLGKTVQAIAWMLSAVPRASGRNGSGGTLVVAPLTLLSNWEHELSRFAPGLSVYLHHGAGRRAASGFRAAAAKADVVLTSYQLLVKDQALFADVKWEAMALDEAQTVKNPDSLAARAACALSPPRRIALTGTPVENTAADIWSIEEFLNPGFLGDRRSFMERFARPIAEDGGCAAARRLRRALEPFAMRRMKTDPSIAAELGARRETREYCVLSPAWRRAYESALDAWRFGERTRGDALALLTRLKIVCDGFDGAKVSGGKAERLLELLGQIAENGESALVFTQYAKVGAALRNAIAERTGRRPGFLHGGLTPSEREAQVAKFTRTPGPQTLVLSLRAGGVGLNLTKATHVIHYDRWWNPAVESQATDRAHRIGQSKDVLVHLFISSGTVEERIDGMLRRKESLKSLVSDATALWSAVALSP